MKHLTGIGIACFLAFAASASVAQQSCTPTPSDNTISYPGRDAIWSSNKLARPAGKSEYANGQLLHFYGTLRDQQCKPVSNARIELWQPNPAGKYVRVNRADHANPQSLFTGTGVAYTDNQGRFAFETLYPGAYGKRSPHVHIRITHEMFPRFNGTLYFAGDIRNDDDRRLKRYSPSNRSRMMIDLGPRVEGDPNAGLKGYIELVLKGTNPWKKY